MEKENTGLYQEVQENVAAQNRADDRTAEIFAFFDEVWHRVLRLWQSYRLSVLTSTASLAVVFTQIYAKWKELPLEDMQAWTLLTAETQSAINPPP